MQEEQREGGRKSLLLLHLVFSEAAAVNKNGKSCGNIPEMSGILHGKIRDDGVKLAEFCWRWMFAAEAARLLSPAVILAERFISNQLLHMKKMKNVSLPAHNLEHFFICRLHACFGTSSLHIDDNDALSRCDLIDLTHYYLMELLIDTVIIM